MEQVVIVHISDLHLGSSALPHWLPKKTGRRAHDFKKCEPLYFALQDARIQAELEDGEPLHVVMSGDLTSGGSEAEFAFANEFIHSRYDLPGQDPIDPVEFGLSIPREHTFASVAGNHDHANDGYWFPGFPLVQAYNSSIYPSHFEAAPFHRTWKSVNDMISVELYGIDSASGLLGKSTNFRANGQFADSSLKTLTSLLDESLKRSHPNHAHRVRLLVCHHALGNQQHRTWIDSPPRLYDDVFANNTVDDYSYHRLLEIAAKYDVAVILSGHIHRFEAVNLLRRRDGSLLKLEHDTIPELTCSTTLQEPTAEHIGFWLHRIQLVNNSLCLTSQKFVWNGAHFIPSLSERPLKRELRS